KSKIAYAKKKYDQARAISQQTGAGDTEQETLREQMLSICPHFDKVHAVYGGSLARNPPPPNQSVTFPDDPPHRHPLRLPILEISDREVSSESSESEADIAEIAGDFNSEENRKDNRRRELALEAKEQAIAEKMDTLAEKLLDIEKDNDMTLKERARKYGAMLKERAREQDASFMRRTQQFESKKAEFKQEKENFKQEKDEFGRLHFEHAVMKTELELVRAQLNSRNAAK
ncbi:hypothetical protein BGZ54_001415, partial [Gamsiella multidivaricata]